MTVLFTSLVAAVIPKLDALLVARPEPFTGSVLVTNRMVANRNRVVTVSQGPGSGAFDTLDDTTLRVNVYVKEVKNSNSEADAEDLALMVRALFEGPLRDGDPITYARVTAGPVEVQNATGFHQWYSVVDLTRRGTQIS